MLLRLLVAVVVFAPAYAHADVPARLTLGVKLGVDYSIYAGWTQDRDNDSPPAFKRGSAYGATVAYRIDERFAAEVGVMRLHKGAQVHRGQLLDGTYFQLVNDLRFVEVPVHAVFRRSLAPALALRLFAGPSVGYLGSAGLYTIREGRAELAEYRDVVELSASVGFGAAWQLGGATVVLDATYLHGVTAWDAFGHNDDPLVDSVVSRTVLATLGVRFSAR